MNFEPVLAVRLRLQVADYGFVGTRDHLRIELKYFTLNGEL